MHPAYLATTIVAEVGAISPSRPGGRPAEAAARGAREARVSDRADAAGDREDVRDSDTASNVEEAGEGGWEEEQDKGVGEAGQ